MGREEFRYRFGGISHVETANLESPRTRRDCLLEGLPSIVIELDCLYIHAHGKCFVEQRHQTGRFQLGASCRSDAIEHTSDAGDAGVYRDVKVFAIRLIAGWQGQPEADLWSG